jgi:hypothetical protein
MATFLVERYWPGITPAAAEAATAKLGRDGNATVASAETTESGGPSGGPSGGRSGSPSGGRRSTTVDAAPSPSSPSSNGRMVVVETIVAAADEVCFWYVEAATEREITSAFRAAGIPIDRIGPATALPDLPRASRHANPPARG